MDKIEFPLIFSLFIITVICSNNESAIFNDPELNHTDIVNTNTVGHQVMNSLSCQDNASQNVRREILQNLKNFSNKRSHIFIKDYCKGLVILNKLLKIHDYTWQNNNQSILNNIRIIIVNHNSKEIVNYLENLKKQCTFPFENSVSYAKKTVNRGRLKNTYKMPHKTTNKHPMVAYHGTVDEYVFELRKVFDIVSCKKTRRHRGAAIQTFFSLMSDIININDYANHKNITDITRNEIDVFCSICVEINYRYFNQWKTKCNFSDSLTKLYVNSLQLFCETRIREKCLLLPEFFCLYDYAQRFYKIAYRILNIYKILIVYIVSRIEIVISKMIILKNDTIEMQDIIQEDYVTYRSFVREILISTFLHLLRVNSRHICRYIMTSQFEYLYIVMNTSQCIDYKVMNLYNIVFLIFSTFTVKFNIFQPQSIDLKMQNYNNINYVRYNRIFLSLLSHRSKEFKEALKKGIQKVFRSDIFKFAQFKNLQKSICAQIDGLDENNHALMILKVNAIYDYIQNRLLEGE